MFCCWRYIISKHISCFCIYCIYRSKIHYFKSFVDYDETSSKFFFFWCRSAYNRLIDSVLNDALRIVTGCLRPTPTDCLPVLAGIQPAELRRLGATLSLAYRGSLDPDHILYELLAGPSDVHDEKLKSRRPFVSAAGRLLHNLFKLDISAAQCTDYKWSTE